MKKLYLDCFAGISGDMFVGALLDLGVDFNTLESTLRGLPLDNYQINTEQITKNNITGTKFNVNSIETEKRHRHLKDIYKIIDDSTLSSAVKSKSKEIFLKLAKAEAKIHGYSIDKVHFHEVGALDSIIDIIATLICLELLKVEQIICSPLPLGSGYTRCAHGLIPLPAPATLELLRGIPITETDIQGETVTPTGAALVSCLVNEFAPLPTMKVEGVGYGPGTRDSKIPNLLRAIIGSQEKESPYLQDKVWVITTNIDDMNPEFYDYIFDQLFRAGALDVSITPLYMKKNRPAQELSVICHSERVNALSNIVLKETTSFGLRLREESRYMLKREFISVETTYGPVIVKLGKCPSTGEIINISPEWEECRKLAEKLKKPVKEIYDQTKAIAITNFSE